MNDFMIRTYPFLLLTYFIIVILKKRKERKEERKQKELAQLQLLAKEKLVDPESDPSA